MSELRLDPIVGKWLRDGTDVGPEHGLNRALAATKKVHQRPGWTFPDWWLPTPVAGAGLRIPRLAVLGLLVVLTLAIVAVAAAIGGTVLRSIRSGEQGSLIAYQDGAAIWAARPDGSDRRELSAAVPFARLPVFSPDGQWVAFVAPSSAGSRTGKLLVVPVNGTGPPIDVSDAIELLASDVPQFTWSPDGGRIAFSAPRNGVATIFVTASGGGQAPVPITNEEANRDLPTWSPDGDSIGFRERDPDGVRTRLRHASPDGTNLQEITLVIAADAFLSKPRWTMTNDSTSYWYNVGFGSDTTAYIDLGATHKNQPWAGEPGGFADMGLPWSPDGEQLAILTRDDGVILADYDKTEPYDGQLRRLGAVASCWVDWAPSGTALYGGSPGDCSGVVVIPLANPDAATTVPGSTAGVASWQPMAK